MSALAGAPDTSQVWRACAGQVRRWHSLGAALLLRSSRHRAGWRSARASGRQPIRAVRRAAEPGRPTARQTGCRHDRPVPPRRPFHRVGQATIRSGRDDRCRARCPLSGLRFEAQVRRAARSAGKSGCRTLAWRSRWPASTWCRSCRTGPSCIRSGSPCYWSSAQALPLSLAPVRGRSASAW